MRLEQPPKHDYLAPIAVAVVHGKAYVWSEATGPEHPGWEGLQWWLHDKRPGIWTLERGILFLRPGFTMEIACTTDDALNQLTPPSVLRSNRP